MIDSPPLTSVGQALALGAAGVSLRSVTKRYGGVTAVAHLTLDIPAGYYCCLLGPSGCGKTTVLRMIAGHEEITEGEIWMGDRCLNPIPAAKRNTSMMFQSYALFPHQTVWQNVEFGLRMQGIAAPERRARVGEMLDTLGLSCLAQRKPARLSGGQQQRVALARALVTRPQVLLLDEPLSALDENLRIRTRAELRKLQRQFGMTFIQVTHNQDEAYSLSDQIVVMDHGRIDQVGRPDQIFAQPLSQFVATFTGDNNLFQGTVARVVKDGEPALIELEVPQLGIIFCRGEAPQLGVTAACCLRSDALTLTPLDTLVEAHPSPNRFTARIAAVEFTGYITRVFLILDANGQELLYKARTVDWARHAFQEGQAVTLSWTDQDCRFLAH